MCRMDSNAHSSISNGQDLEQYRRAAGLSYQDLADLIGEMFKSSVRNYAIGKTWPRPETLRCILTKCGGAVTIEAMHRRHCAYLECIGKLAPVHDAE